MDKKIFPERNIETDPIGRKIEVHAAMYYQCENCGKTFRFWLEKGLEDKMQDAINPENHKPVPFLIRCLCGGIAKHIAWNEDIRFDRYVLLKDDMNYFENAGDYDCGVSHFRNFGEAEIDESNLQSVFELLKKEQIKQMKEMEASFCKGEEDDDPYGLAHVSTSRLKAELRRRKRW